MKHPVKIVIADDHPVLLEGMVHIINNELNNINIFKATNGAEALQLINNVKPDIAILDIEMPLLNGVEVAKSVLKTKLPTKIIFLTLHKEKSFFEEIAKMNISGYVLKEFSIDEITTCIKTVIKGKKYFSTEIQNYLEEPVIDLSIFTKTELNILKLIAKEKTTKEIANMLFISDKTVQTHRYNICKKLQLKPEKNSLLRWVFQNLHIF
jgi:DNA-binding NarL/FixJ family response regulator